MHPDEVTSAAAGHRYHGYVEYQGIGLRQQFPAEKKWALGLQVLFFLACNMLCLPHPPIKFFLTFRVEEFYCTSPLLGEKVTPKK